MNQSLPIDQNGEQPQEAPDYSDIHYGEVLKKTRLHYGLTIQDVEGLLRIRASYILALEENNLETLPGRVYAIGFLRSYSEFLGLDGDKMTYLFKQQSGNSVQKPAFQVPVAASESKLPNLYILGAALLVLSVIAYGVKFQSKPTETVAQAIPSVEDVLPQDVVREVARQTAADADAAVYMDPAFSLDEVESAAGEVQMESMPSGAYDQVETLLSANVNSAQQETESTVQSVAEPVVYDIKIKVIESSWVDVVNPDGERLVSKVLKPGTEYIIPNRPQTILSSGNLGGLEVYYKDELQPKLGLSGEVGENIDLFIQENPEDDAVAALTDGGSGTLAPSDPIGALIEAADLDAVKTTAELLNDIVPAAGERAAMVDAPREVDDSPVVIPKARPAAIEQRARNTASGTDTSGPSTYEGFPYSGNPYGRLNR